ncbi:TonB-dependent receptor [Rhizomicrobium palustre]|uniref:TonB-dependent receptor n=1 Tax=Rhizomicrobium palustre TaxID=189966 RepID=A0A846MVL7_9PROT|nr:TonB-dependent receptor [Rhizomicrobium palustre]NIK87201.1 TonB-dependent receptor [Rhizomicrobium palustre]
MKSRLRFSTQTAAIALLVGMTGAAVAQSNEPVETVTVTGYRAALASALNAKQNSSLVMESVAAEDIGKMPDQNVTESLQRLPGIQIARDQGKGTRVLINGLRQNLTTLNGDIFLTGKEFYVSGEAANGGAGANAQYASMEGIPSEEIGGIDVYKTPTAALTEGGMGGIINLKTRDPFAAKDEFSVTAALRGTSTSYSSLARLSPNATLVASYKPNNTFAITGSVSYDNTDTRTREYEAYNRAPWNISTTAVKGYSGTGPLNDTNGETNISQSYISPQYGYFSDIYSQNRTIGGTLGAAWNVTSSVQTTLNYFYSHISDKQTNFSNKVGFNGSGASSNTPGSGMPGINADKPYSIDGNGVIDTAQFYLQGAETATLLQRQNSDAHNLQWHTSFDDGGPLTFSLDVSYAVAHAKLRAAQQDIEHGFYTAQGGTTSAAPTAPGCNNFSPACTNGNPPILLDWNNGGDSGLPSATYVGKYADALSNPAYVLFKSAWAWANQSKQEQDAIRAEAVYKPGFLKSVDGFLTAGFRVAQRNVWQNFGRYLIDGRDVNGNYINNCCYAAGNGPGLYYQDPGYAAIPYDTAVSNPSLALTVNSFAFGNMIVKNPTTGGMGSPETFLNTIWNQAANVPTNTPAAIVNGTTVTACTATPAPAACAVPAKTKVPNNSEALYTDTLSSFKVHESTQSFYVMGDIGTKDKGFHINGGVRVVLTSQSVTGATSAATVYSAGTATWNGVNSNNIPFTQVKHSVDILPSFNLTLYPTDEQIIRLSAARVVSPADLFNLGLGQSYNFTRETGGRVNTNKTSPSYGTKDGYRFANGSSGNPQLDPYRANQFNLSWEDYFAPEAMISAGIFYKQIESFEVNQPVNTTVVDDFGGSAGPVSMAVNAGHGSIYGLELAGQYVTDIGLGLAANYTYTQSSSAMYTDFAKHLPIPDVSDHSATATVFYSKFGLDARMSYSWRSKAVNGGIGGSTFSPVVSATGNSKTYGIYSAPYGQLDAQVSYDFFDHYQIYVSAQNLTEEAYHTYMQFPNQPFTYDNSGTRYFFGVRASF